MTGLHLQMLGGFSISIDDSPITGFHQPRLQALLAYLVLNRERPQSRSFIAFLFWPDSTEKQARTNLRKLVYSLRKTLPESDSYLTLTTETIGWRNDAPFYLDVAEFEGCLAGTAVNKSALKEAVAAYRGELLPGFYDEWILAERERLRSLYGEALLKLAALYETERDYPVEARLPSKPAIAPLVFGAFRKQTPPSFAHFQKTEKLTLPIMPGAAMMFKGVLPSWLPAVSIGDNGRFRSIYPHDLSLGNSTKI